MKNLLIIVLLLPVVAFSQENNDSVRHWDFEGVASFNFSQVSLTNWAAGGKSSTSGVSFLNMSANYKRDKINWENNLDMGYGLLKEDKDDAVKSEDKIEFSSKFGYKKTEKILFSSLFNFRTQFAPGYNYPNTVDEISKFMAPGYLTLAIGIDYKPLKIISILVSPVTGKMTLVNDDVLSDSGSYGVDPGKKSRGEFGAYIKAELKADIMKNVNLQTKIDLFSNYLDKPENIDIKWDLLINMKINDYLSANLITNMIYDDDIKLPVDNNDDGVAEKNSPMIQFKEMFGLGLSLKF